MKNGEVSTSGPEEDVLDVAAAMLERMEIENAQARSAAGALTSHPKSNFSSLKFPFILAKIPDYFIFECYERSIGGSLD